MSEEIKEVKPGVDPSATSNEAVETAETTAAQPQDQPTATEGIETQPPVAVDGNQPVDALDESGVPWKNRYFEWKRKAEDLAEKLPSLVEEKITNALKQHGTGQQREYTIGELEAYALEHPEHRGWVEEQKEVIREKKSRKMFEEIVGSREKKQQDEIKKQQSLKYVMDMYPDAFHRSPQGQVMGWNNQHPLTQQIGILMQDPRFQGDPDGLSAAADIAYARYVRAQRVGTQQQQVALKREVKDLQRKTLVEGGGKQSIPTEDPAQSALSRLKKTGSMKDAEAAMKAIFQRARARASKEE